MSILLSLHILAVVLWVGGMLFAHFALRPAALETLEPPQRLPLWLAVFKRFFFLVWVAVVTVLATGYGSVFIYLNGFANVGLYVHIMSGLGLLMAIIFAVIYFVPFQKLKQAVNAQDWPKGGKQLNRIRMLVTTNMILGIVTIFVAVLMKQV